MEQEGGGGEGELVGVAYGGASEKKHTAYDQHIENSRLTLSSANLSLPRDARVIVWDPTSTNLLARIELPRTGLAPTKNSGKCKQVLSEQ